MSEQRKVPESDEEQVPQSDTSTGQNEEQMERLHKRLEELDQPKHFPHAPGTNKKG